MQTGSTSGAAPEFCSLLVLLPASPPERFLLGQTAEPGTAEQSDSSQKTAVHPTGRGTLVFTEVCHGFLPEQPVLWGSPPPPAGPLWGLGSLCSSPGSHAAADLQPH